MTLGFSVETLLPDARVSGRLRIGLVRLAQDLWLDAKPDLEARSDHFDRFPESVSVLGDGKAAASELAHMLGTADLESAARSVWEDLCILTRGVPGEPYRLTAAAVAFPTDWRLSEKMGKPLHAVHEPIHGYAEQLSDGVDRFMDGLQIGAIFGRTNMFVLATDALRYSPDCPPEVRFAHVTPQNAGSKLFVRCERETLRKLPQTGAIAFTIGIYREKLEALSDRALTRIASSIDGFLPGEDLRRVVPGYASALAGYAALRNCAKAA